MVRYLVKRHRSRKRVCLGLVVRIRDGSDVLVGKKAPTKRALKEARRIDKDDRALALGRLVSAAEQDASLHGTVVKETGSEPEHAVDEVGLDDALAHLVFLVAK